MKKNKKGIIVVLVSAVLLVVLNYFLLLPLNFKFLGTSLTVTLFVVINCVVLNVLSLISQSKTEGKKSKTGFIIAGVLVLAIIAYGVINSSMFRADEYRNLIGNVEQKEFTNDIHTVDLTQLPIVDKKLAENLGDKKLGTYVGLGSQVTLGEFTKQNVNGQLYWVSPLLHSGFFKWMNNKEGTTGYIMVNATNTKDVKLVDKLNGKPLKIKYQPNAYFSTDLKRHVYMKAERTAGLTDFSFELDDTGKPYWVITKYINSIGFSGEKILGVIVVDAQSGEIKEYDTNNIPSWVDRVAPDFVIRDRIDWWGELVHGFFNFSKKDMLTSTKGMNMVYNNGECYYYTGITSVGSDEAIVGFILTNTKTMNSTFYKVSGSTEIAGMQSAEGKVQNLQYKATFPILINVENIPTYFMSLKDKKGLIKQYAMVSVEDYSIVGVGETIKDAKSNYVKTLKNKGNITLKFTGEQKKLQGTIMRIGSFNIEGTTYYNFIIKEKPDTIFTASAAISSQLPLTREGDNVSFSYNETESSSIDVLEFNNINIKGSK
ncbi:cell shape-determining protein [Clostridium ganghwense]|uniref:Cell shape-determining protein n=1 Tax=Clostridium ganghwense TaxID=312089 RepID=A0ABT4CKI8_9CLOT|nr:cell shape-determining protein [Clostridium ganghwense]MCY6369438.1 cell shape-determining protein [Clostridium ganghwense]